MSLSVEAVCQKCGASQLSNSMILQGPSDLCDLEHIWGDKPPAPVIEPVQRSQPAQLPYQDEVKANDSLDDHREKVEQNINRTSNTIDRLNLRNDSWIATVHDDFENIINAALEARERVLSDLATLYNNKKERLEEQLEQYESHLYNVNNLLNEIKRRIHEEPRTRDRCEQIVADCKTLTRAFPRLSPIPIVVAVESQTQPIVDQLTSFGAVLETELGRLPMVVIRDAVRGSVSFDVLEPADNDWDEKLNVATLGLEVEVQATAFVGQSMGWERCSSAYSRYTRASGSVKVDTVGLPRGKPIIVRARTILMPKKDGEPLRVSAWSEVMEMASSGARPQQTTAVVEEEPGMAQEPQRAELPDEYKVMVKLFDPESNKTKPTRLTSARGVIGALRDAFVAKHKWQCDPQEIHVRVLDKSTNDLVVDLMAESDPDGVFVSVFDAKAHVVAAVRGGAPVQEEPQQPAEPQPRTEVVEWPKMLRMHILREEGSSEKLMMPLAGRKRVHEGDWIALVKAKVSNKWKVDMGGNVDMYFVDESGARVRDVNEDADLLFAAGDGSVKLVCRPAM